VVSDKSCAPHDVVLSNSYLETIYTSKKFQQFIQSVLSIEKIYPYADSLSYINYNFYQKNQQLGWHFDNASFAITLMIQSSSSGGKFQYVVDVRNVEKNTVNIPLIESVLQNKYPVEELQIEEGILVLFYGRNYLHRVTPITSTIPRVHATLI
jgi:predicted 2-oxoglutarate/Fe(II)-dependent dioxygenase YbiX